jgi:predicted nucleic acid-binding protein
MPDRDPCCFVDTNIWLYAFVESGEPAKSARARALLHRTDIAISSQVVNEVCVNLIKKARFPEPDVRKLVTTFHRRYRVVAVDMTVQLEASMLRETHSLSFWDSLIIASALAADADVLYSEDMQHGLEVAGMRIINPLVSETGAVTP